MPHLFKACALAIMALAVLAPAAVVACNDAGNCSKNELSYETYSHSQNYRSAGGFGYGQFIDAPGMRGFGPPPPRVFGYGDRHARPGFPAMPPDPMNRIGRENPLARPGGANTPDYLRQMVFAEGIGRWSPDRFPLKIYFSPGHNVSGYRPSFKAQMIDALNEWVAVSNGKLAWREVQNPAEADIVCEWTSRVNPQRPNEAGYTIAMAKNNPGTPIRTMGKAKVTILTHFNGKVLTDKDMRKVCLHELGHAYGLQGHSPFSDDIMYATTSRHQGDNLSRRDVQSILNLYQGYPSHSTRIGAAK